MEILRDACRAPSGDNAQPWRFLVKGDTIRVINAAEKDTSLFNYKQMTNHVALGSCIENLNISAENRGFHADIRLFPLSDNHLVVAEATLVPDATLYNELAPYISKRATNRKKYYSRHIEPEKLSALSALAHGTGERIAFITGEKVKEVARIVSAGEKLALENRSIHDFLFEHVTWSKEEDSKKHGFFIDTFELSPPQKLAFRLFKNWNVLKLFLPLGISKMIAKDMEKVHATSAAFGAIVLPSGASEDFLKAGMLLERLWLTATRFGLALQGTTGVNFLSIPVLEENPDGLSKSHQDLLRERYADLAQNFGVHNNEKIAFTFRLGYADPPSAMTTRFDPNVVFED